MWSIVLPLQVFSYGSYTILVHLSESSNGKISYSSVSLNFIVELFKFLLSFCFFFVKKTLNNNLNSDQIDKESLQPINNNINQIYTYQAFKYSLYYAIPAFLYFINNNLALYMQFYMDSTTYQMLCNLKILSTGILYYLIMGKNLSKRKWLSLVLLFVAGVFYVFGNIDNTVDNLQDLKSRIYITKLGLCMITVYTIISGFAGVFTEYILKINFSVSIHIQNMYLYTYGCIFNFLSYCLENFYFNYVSSVQSNNNDLITSLFYGFNIFTWLIIITQVYNGFAMSMVMKHSNNLTRLFLISMSLIVTVILSVLLFSLKLNIYFYISFVIILVALHIYIR